MLSTEFEAQVKTAPKAFAIPGVTFAKDDATPWPRGGRGLQRLLARLDTLESAGIPNAQSAGIFSRIKRLHDPITYMILAAAAGFRWEWCFRNPYYWFAVGFCIKWYRARYVFKIPVWDRQPNWNNIITSKEQEKDLKAFTCKQEVGTVNLVHP